MDTPTAMAMATTYGVALLGRRTGVAGGVLCAIGALAPDLDALLPGGTDTFVRWHRGPTHSLVFLAVCTPLMAWIARRAGAQAPFRWLCAASALGLTVGIGSDLVTWWGTVVLWPFSRVRVGIGLIFIIDLWHSLIVFAPLGIALVQRMRKRPFPRRAFRWAALASVAWFGVCGLGRTQAIRIGGELAERRDAVLIDVLPQPLSPFLWSCILGTDTGRTMVFIDCLRPESVLEEREFPDAPHSPASTAVAATEQAALLRWFYRHPYERLLDSSGERAVIEYEDLSYQMRLPGRRGPARATPFRYRFHVEGSTVTNGAWVEEE